jgi:hypothetical protein
MAEKRICGSLVWFSVRFFRGVGRRDGSNDHWYGMGIVRFSGGHGQQREEDEEEEEEEELLRELSRFAAEEQQAADEAERKLRRNKPWNYQKN